MSDDPKTTGDVEPAVPTLRERIQQEVDELQLQIHLGKAEAEDYIEKHKGNFSGFLEKVRDKIDAGSEIGAEKAKVIRQKVDELRLQLALGKMESRDAYEEQKSKIGGAISALQEELEPVSEKMGGYWKSLKSQFEAGSEALKTKIDALGLQFGLAKMELGDEVKLKKEQLGEELRDLSVKLQDAGGAAKNKMGEVGKDLSEMYSGLRQRLKDLF